jgi:hypothetical protein
MLPGFWPGLPTLARAARAGTIVLRDDRPFSPGDGLHRARIRAPGGETWLTLPVRATPPGTLLAAVELAPPDTWAPRALRVIEHAFACAPYLEHYRCDLARVLFRGGPRLVDLNEAMLRLLLHAFGIPAQVVRASAVGEPYPTDLHERVADRPAIELLFWHGPGARALLDAVPRPAPRRIRLRSFADRARARAARPALGA